MGGLESPPICYQKMLDVQTIHVIILIRTKENVMPVDVNELEKIAVWFNDKGETYDLVAQTIRDAAAEILVLRRVQIARKSGGEMYVLE